ncbi:unnamed protein product, partial [Prorocentrum cordatum]
SRPAGRWSGLHRTGMLGPVPDSAAPKALAAAERNLAHVVAAVGVPIIGVDTKGFVNEWNPKAEELSGYLKKDVVGKDLIQEFVGDDSKVRVQRTLYQALLGQETVGFQLPLLTSSGKCTEMRLAVAAMRDGSEIVSGVMFMGQDIPQTSSPVVHSGGDTIDDMTRLMDVASVPTFALDREGRITEWSQTAAATSGRPRADAVGQPLLKSFVDPGDRDDVSRALSEAME